MSMRAIEYQGYGFDLTEGSGAFDTIEHIEELSTGLPIYDYDGVIFCTPCNTDDFGLLVLIDAVIPVGFTVRTYTVEEANSLLVTAVCELIKSGIGTYTTQDDVDIVRSVLTANIVNLAGYSYDKGPWTDMI